MKTLCAAACLLFVVSTAVAAPKTGFSCDQIKDKAVRASCLESQSKKEEPAIDRELAAFVDRAKKKLLDALIDPDSAKFTGLYVVTNSNMPGRRFLCGSVNSKNSYGGYVGAKPFWVKESVDDGGALILWMSKQTTQSFEYDMAKLYCTGTKSVPIPD